MDESSWYFAESKKPLKILYIICYNMSRKGQTIDRKQICGWLRQKGLTANGHRGTSYEDSPILKLNRGNSIHICVYVCIYSVWMYMVCRIASISSIVSSCTYNGKFYGA